MEIKTGSFTTVLATTLLWALLWALPGGVIEAIDNIAPAAHHFTRQIDMWPQTLGLPGLLVGALVVWVVAPGLSEPGELAVGLVGCATLLGTVSGVGSPLLFRYADQRRASAKA